MGTHDFQEIYCANNVVVIVKQRFLYTFTYSLQSSEVDDRIKSKVGMWITHTHTHTKKRLEQLNKHRKILPVRNKVASSVFYNEDLLGLNIVLIGLY